MKFFSATIAPLAVILLLLASGCSTLPGEPSGSPQDPLAHVTWYLLSMGGEGPGAGVVNGTTITALFDGNGTLAGSGGCNTYTAPYQDLRKAFSIGAATSTEISCTTPLGVMAQESRYLSLLPNASGYHIEGTRLQITDKEGSPLLTYTSLPPDLAGTWQVLTFGTSDGQTWTPGTLTTITLRFHPEGSISGNAGCNDYQGTFLVTGTGSLSLSPSGMTKMFCGIGGVMELENAYIGYLPGMTQYSITGSRLLLSDDSGHTRLLFDRKPS